MLLHLPISLILATAYWTSQPPCTFDVDLVVMYVAVVIYFYSWAHPSSHLTSILQDKSSWQIDRRVHPLNSLGYYLDKWTGPCTWAGGWLHLDKWLLCTWSSAPTNWPLDQVPYSRDLDKRPLFPLDNDWRPTLRLLKSVKCTKLIFSLNGTCTSGTWRHSAKWYLRLICLQ